MRLGTDLVNLLFSAVDRNNRVVSDIRQEEIVVLEDGRPQQLFTFKRETTLPINIAILMDLSGSQEYTFPQEKMAAGEFLRSVIRPGQRLCGDIDVPRRRRAWSRDSRRKSIASTARSMRFSILAQVRKREHAPSGHRAL